MIDDISDLLHDPDFETEFVVDIVGGERKDDGEWVETVKSKPKRGVIQPASYRDTEFLDEGDRNRQAINIWSDEYLSASDRLCPQNGDIIKWQCREYRIVSVRDWSEYGYWRATAVQLIYKEDGHE